MLDHSAFSNLNSFASTNIQLILSNAYLNISNAYRVYFTIHLNIYPTLAYSNDYILISNIVILFREIYHDRYTKCVPETSILSAPYIKSSLYINILFSQQLLRVQYTYNM